MTANKTVIITGGNSGLGFVATETIAKANKGWHVVLACRNIAKGEEARRKLVDLTGGAAISVLELDLASLHSVRNFAAAFATLELPPLHGLINNAGMQALRNGLEYTKDGYEVTFGVNHLGHFLLTNLLLDKLAEPARIIIVSSGTHDPDTIDGRFIKPVFLGAKRLARPESEKEMSGMQRYTTSKLANILFAYELTRRLKDKKIIVNVFDPVATPGTDLIKNPVIRWISRRTWVLNMFGIKTSTPEISGSAMARPLLDDTLAAVSGRYFRVQNEVKSSKQSYDARLAAELWSESLELTVLNQ